MSAVTRRKTATFAATAAAGAFAATVMLAGPAYADGTPSTKATPFTGRTEGGSLILKDGDIIACAAVGQLQVVQPNGVIRETDGAGTKFTTPAGTRVLTIRQGTVKVTVDRVSAEVTCGKELFPTTTAFVPSTSLKDGVKAGAGGTVSGLSTATMVGGGGLAAAGLVGGAVLLRRRGAAGSRV
ncbi:hypothetical protein [Streptomyces sp. NPDC050287]|uniref:hypothetical protein n=1 Tax=Streptomyces sp. NPDC050287 TaxID=3365608 RepID=UPI0037A42901